MSDCTLTACPHAASLQLSATQKRAILALSADWSAGPDLPDHVLSELNALQAAGLVMRRFGDQALPALTVDEDAIRLKVRACWHFCLTPLGITVRTLVERSL